MNCGCKSRKAIIVEHGALDFPVACVLAAGALFVLLAWKVKK